jgi:Ca2+-binding RTX toxin-like protein
MPTVFGDNNPNVLNSYDNTYTVYGLGQSDRLSGGVMYGGTGDDHYLVDNVSDQVVEYANEGIWDEVTSSLSSYTLPANVEHLYLYSNSKADGIGNDLNNSILGNQASNKLEGKGGHDFLAGDRGNDTLIGGSGNDELVGYGALASNSTYYYGYYEIDILEGGTGKDKYVLGWGNNVAYRDLNRGIQGLNDYALIKGFNAQDDKIQLGGNITQYVFDVSPIAVGSSSVSDTGIYHMGDGTRELIGIIQDFAHTQLKPENLVFLQ